MPNVKIIGLKKFLCQLNWTMSMASFNIWCPRYFFLPNYYQNGQNVVVSAYSTDPSWGRTDQQGGNCQIRFFFVKGGNFGAKFTLLRGF